MEFDAIIKLAAGKLLGISPDVLLAGNITDGFSWVNSGRIGWVRAANSGSVVLLLDDRGVQRLNAPDDHSALAALLVRDAGYLPTRLSPTELAEAIRRLGVDPRGFVGSPQFWEQQKAYVRLWCGGDDADLAAKFKAGCAAPELTSDQGGTWQLKFLYFNANGGVEQWLVNGDRERFNAIKTVKFPDRTFVFPYG